MGFDAIYKKDIELNRKYDYINRDDEKALQDFVVAENEIKSFIDLCLSETESNCSFPQYSWLCATITRWSNFILVNTGKYIPLEIPLSENIYEYELGDINNELEKTGVSEDVLSKVEDLIYSYISSTEKNCLLEAWIRTQVHKIVDNIQVLKLILGRMTLTSDKLTVHKWEGDSKQIIRGQDIIKHQDSEMFLECA